MQKKENKSHIFQILEEEIMPLNLLLFLRYDSMDESYIRDT